MLDRLLTVEQEQLIVEIIKTQCRRYQHLEQERTSLFYEPYTQMRKKHEVTSAVISGFAPGRIDIEGIQSTDLDYGLHDKLAQPELRCENGIFHIYSDGSDLKGKKILERCEAMNTDVSHPPLFFVIVFFVSDDGVLKKIEMRLPNKDGKIIEKRDIYRKPKITAMTA